MESSTVNSLWVLYENYSGLPGKLVGVFSSSNKAKDCSLVQPMLTESWQIVDCGGGRVIWVVNAKDTLTGEQFNFSVEEIQVDRLVRES